MSKEAMKLALEWIEAQPEPRMLGALKAITALREALAEQLAQQEPVAYLVDDDLYYPEEIDWETLQEQGHTVAALYTSPPAQRTWVGLTDEDDIDWEEGGNLKDLVKAIEAKLKEKNT